MEIFTGSEVTTKIIFLVLFFQLFKNNMQIHEINAKSGISIAEVNGLCEDEVAADGGCYWN